MALRTKIVNTSRTGVKSLRYRELKGTDICTKGPGDVDGLSVI